MAVAAAAAAAAAFGTWPCFSIPRELTVLLHSMWQRFWAHGFVQCPFATNKAHELNFAAEGTPMTAKTIVRRMANNLCATIHLPFRKQLSR